MCLWSSTSGTQTKLITEEGESSIDISADFTSGEGGDLFLITSFNCFNNVYSPSFILYDFHLPGSTATFGIYFLLALVGLVLALPGVFVLSVPQLPCHLLNVWFQMVHWCGPPEQNMLLLRKKEKKKMEKKHQVSIGPLHHDANMIKGVEIASYNLNWYNL